MVQEVLQRKWEPWIRGVQWLAIESWQWPVDRIIKADPLTTTWEVAQELKVDHSVVMWHLKLIGKVKKPSKWVPHELTKLKKIIILKCHLLFYATTMNHFSIRLWHATKSGFYTTTSNKQLSGWTEKKLRSISQS